VQKNWTNIAHIFVLYFHKKVCLLLSSIVVIELRILWLVWNLEKLIALLSSWHIFILRTFFFGHQLCLLLYFLSLGFARMISNFLPFFKLLVFLIESNIKVEMNISKCKEEFAKCRLLLSILTKLWHMHCTIGLDLVVVWKECSTIDPLFYHKLDLSFL